MFLRLQPYIQTSLVQRPYQKLAFRYYGPYKIIARVGDVAYKLQLPEGSKIHDVLHVSQLKQAVGLDVTLAGLNPLDDAVLQSLHVPCHILDNMYSEAKGAPR